MPPLREFFTDSIKIVLYLSTLFRSPLFFCPSATFLAGHRTLIGFGHFWVLRARDVPSMLTPNGSVAICGEFLAITLSFCRNFRVALTSLL
jgi:hypothetical protein